MIRNIKKFGSQVSIVIILFMLVTSVPIATVGYSGFASAEQDQQDIQKAYNGEAEAIAPAVIGAGAVAGTVGAVAGTGIGYAGGYLAGNYFSDANEAVEEDINGTIDDATNQTLRESVHSNSIISEGTTESYYDNVENDINTIEGSLKQTLSQKFIGEANNISSESEAINIAENTASNYLSTTQGNIVNTTNFHSLSVAQYQSQLQTANASDDIYAKSPRTGTVSTSYRSISPHTNAIYDVEQLDNGKIVSSSADETVKIFDQQGNVDLTFSGHTNNVYDIEQMDDGRLVSASNDNTVKIFDQQGNVDLTFDGHSGKVNDVEQLDNSKIASGAWDNSVKIYDQQGNVDLNFSGHSGKVNDVEQLKDGRIISVSGNDDTVKIYDQQGNVEMTFSGHTNMVNDVEQLDNSKIASGAWDDSVKITSIFNINTITFDPSDVSSSNLQTKVDMGDENYTGVNVALSSSYSSDDAKVLVPYVNNSGSYQPLDYNNKETVAIDTPTSGIAGSSEPLNYPRALDTIQNRDSLSDQTYSIVSSFASGVWNDSIKTVANDANKSIYDDSNITEELATFEKPTASVDNPQAVLSYYVGVYESTTAPATDRLTITDNATGDTVATGALFSTDIQKLAGGDNNITEGDKLNTTGVSNTLIVDGQTGEKTVLEQGKIYNVSNISDNQTEVDIRTYELQSTNLSDQAERLQDASDTVEETVDNPPEITFPEFPDLGGNGRIVIVLIGLVLVGWVVGRSN